MSKEEKEAIKMGLSVFTVSVAFALSVVCQSKCPAQESGLINA